MPTAPPTSAAGPTTPTATTPTTPTPTTPTPTTATSRHAAPTRRVALVGGALYLVTFASSIPAALLLAPLLGDPAYVLGPGADTRVTVAALLDLVNLLACVGTAVVLFGVVARQSLTLAVGFLASRLVEAAVLFVGVLSVLAVVTLRGDVGGPGAADPGALTTVAAALVAVRDWTFLLGPGMAAANALVLGTALYRSRLVPRVIPVLGLVGAPLLLLANGLTMFGHNEQVSVVSALALPGIFLWELSLGLYLVLRGFRPSPVLDGPVQHRSMLGDVAEVAPAPARAATAG